MSDRRWDTERQEWVYPQDWRKIDDNHPQPDWLVLTLWNGVNNKTGEPARYYEIASWDVESGDWVDQHGDVVDTPTHWLPLPDAPNE